jgi:hypothetical protein
MKSLEEGKPVLSAEEAAWWAQFEYKCESCRVLVEQALFSNESAAALQLLTLPGTAEDARLAYMKQLEGVAKKACQRSAGYAVGSDTHPDMRKACQFLTRHDPNASRALSLSLVRVHKSIEARPGIQLGDYFPEFVTNVTDKVCSQHPSAVCPTALRPPDAPDAAASSGGLPSSHSAGCVACKLTAADLCDRLGRTGRRAEAALAALDAQDAVQRELEGVCKGLRWRHAAATGGGAAGAGAGGRGGGSNGVEEACEAIVERHDEALSKALSLPGGAAAQRQALKGFCVAEGYCPAKKARKKKSKKKKTKKAKAEL